MQSLTHGARQHPSSLCYTVASPLAERMAQCTWCGQRVGPVGLVRLVGRRAQDILCTMCFLNSGAHGTLYAEWRCSNMPAGAPRLCIAPSAIGGSRAKRQPTTCQRMLTRPDSTWQYRRPGRLCRHGRMPSLPAYLRQPSQHSRSRHPRRSPSGDQNSILRAILWLS